METIIVSKVKSAEHSQRERIVETAERRFLPDGFSGVSMDDLARELGMSKKTLYAHFESKEALLHAVLKARIAFVQANLEAIFAVKQPFPEKLQAILHFLHERMSEVSPAFLNDLRKFAPACFAIVEQFRAQAIPLYFGQMFEEGRQAGHIRDDVDEKLLVRMLLASIQTIVRPEVVAEMRVHPSVIIEGILGIIFNGILTPRGRQACRKIPLS